MSILKLQNQYTVNTFDILILQNKICFAEYIYSIETNLFCKTNILYCKLKLLILFLLQYRCAIPSDADYERMRKVLSSIKPSEPGTHFTSQEYAWRRKFVLLQILNGMKVIVNDKIFHEHVKQHGTANSHSCPRIASTSMVFDAIYNAHDKTGHAKIERTFAYVKKKFSNISRSQVELLLGLCPICAMDKIKPSRKAPHEPILSKTYNDRGQIDMIDMQSSNDGPFKWILHYQDQLTKFSYLRPLRKKSK